MKSSASVIHRYSFCDRKYTAVELLQDPWIDFPILARISRIPNELHALYGFDIVRIEKSVTQLRVLGEPVDDVESGNPVYVSVPIDGAQNFEYEQGNQKIVCGCHYLVTSFKLPVVANIIGQGHVLLRSGDHHNEHTCNKIRLLRTFSQTYLVVNQVTDGHIRLDTHLVSVLEKELRFTPVRNIENEDDSYLDLYQKNITSVINRYGGENNQITGNDEIEYFNHSLSDLKEENIQRTAKYVSLCSTSSPWSRDCHMYDSLSTPNIPPRKAKSCTLPARSHEYHTIEEVQTLCLDKK